MLALLLALVGLTALPSSTAACDAEWPTFSQLLDGSSVIVLGTVTEALNMDDHPFPETYVVSVERVLKGSAGETVTVQQRAYLCGDGLIPDDVGRRILIATDLRFYSATLSPFWWQLPGGRLHGWAETPPGVSSLDELAERIAAALPDTATAAPATASAAHGGRPIALIAAAALGLFVVRGPWLRRRSPSS